MAVLKPQRQAIGQKLIVRAVKSVAAERSLDWQGILSRRRGTRPYAAARVLAMAACCSAGLPMHRVGRAFWRTWQTVDSARQRQTELVMADPVARAEFLRVLDFALGDKEDVA